jgi:RNA polymerase sigma-70 factor (ECF subfamily)
MAGFYMESDEELIALANEGDSQAFEKLYYRYRDWVYQLAWRFTGSREDALDVLQETFTYLLKRLPTLRLTARMTTFLYPAVRHLSLSIRRENLRHVSDDEFLSEPPAPEAKQTLFSRAELAAVLAILPSDQREVLLMRFVDDMTLEDIADALNIPIGTIKSRLYRALQTLRQDGRTQNYFLE